MAIELDTLDRLMDLLDGASEARVAPSLLQPADTFVALAGEEFRHRLFITEDGRGRALCLRPDFTIPVCLEHLAAGRTAPTAYSYRGKIFRKRRVQGEPEFEQAGTEWLGHPNEVETDADVFTLANECALIAGLTPAVRVGDANVFSALTDALGLGASSRARLVAAFGDNARLGSTLARLAAPEEGDGLATRLAPALAKVGREEARAIVDAVVRLPGRGLTAGRTADDIVERIIDQAATNGGDAEAAPLLRDYLAIETPLTQAADALSAFAQRHGLDLAAAIDEFASRQALLQARGIAADRIRFEARFGRRLGYYTGFVFEMTDPAMPNAEVIAGGRYDRLATLLDPNTVLPGIGFSVWLDRLPGGRA